MWKHSVQRRAHAAIERSQQHDHDHHRRGHHDGRHQFDHISLDPKATEPEVKLGSIAIPKLGLDVTVYDGVLLTTLNKGPGHWPGTAMPGQVGNMVVAGHRVTHSRPFRHLDELAVGDPVIFTLADGSSFTYEVVGSEIVTPDSTWIVNQTRAYTATLFACHPPGSAQERFVVHLKLAGT